MDCSMTHRDDPSFLSIAKVSRASAPLAVITDGALDHVYFVDGDPAGGPGPCGRADLKIIIIGSVIVENTAFGLAEWQPCHP
jgi:hypothetical protein